MTTWQAFLLGMIQGITEFLPISSSGHLALGQYFLGLGSLENDLLFNLICHLGTLLSIFYVFFPLIRESLKNPSSRLWTVILGTIPLFPLVLIIKPLKTLFDDPQILGPCFLTSACLLFVSLYYRFPFTLQTPQRRWIDPLTIGLFQAIAVLPGISRSGATISAACLLGWEKKEAVQFSFLLAIPAILGGIVLEGWQVWQSSFSTLSSINPWTFIVGFFTSFFIGCCSLKGLISFMIHDKWVYFAWYCFLLGIFTTFYFNFFY